jgi:hypothetical protein
MTHARFDSHYRNDQNSTDPCTLPRSSGGRCTPYIADGLGWGGPPHLASEPSTNLLFKSRQMRLTYK